METQVLQRHARKYFLGKVSNSKTVHLIKNIGYKVIRYPIGSFKSEGRDGIRF